ncbi:MAG TPA: transcriptional regulator NrdR [Verrucomicrobiae bacterium]|nr:transcriptional regulator NrdR [Verrucomicrobiae bacterium]
MKCPKCGVLDDKVVDSRLSRDGASIRRRRECLACSFRFTTYEGIESQDVRVIKSDGRYQPFDRQKLLNGMMRACEKRPVSKEQIEAAALEIVNELEREYDNEIPARVIGEAVMRKLRELDEVAYVRFASVYRRFEDIGEFEQEIKSMRATRVR